MNQRLMIFSGLLEVIIINLNSTYLSSKYTAAKFSIFCLQMEEEAVFCYNCLRMESKEFKFKVLNPGM